MEESVYRGVLGAGSACLLLIAFQTYLIRVARKRAAGNGTSRAIVFLDLIVTCDDESYSLSRLQMYIWTVAVIMGFAAVWAAGNFIPDIPQNLYVLMGVNVAASVASTAITTAKDKPGDKAPQPNDKKPDFLNDIFFESDGSLDLPRTQMFVWTVISLGAFAFMLVKSFYASPKLPDIPTGLIVLMGISHGAYLGAKAVAPPLASSGTETGGSGAGTPGNAGDATKGGGEGGGGTSGDGAGAVQG